MKAVEDLVTRWTAPLAPFRSLRVLLDGSEFGRKALECECSRLLIGDTCKLDKIIVDWVSIVEAAYNQHGRERLIGAASAIGAPVEPAHAQCLSMWYWSDVEIYPADALNDIGTYHQDLPSVRPMMAALFAT
jgi:hypothetical protein